MSVRHSIGRKKQRAIKGDTNPQLEQPKYNPPRPIGTTWQKEFPAIEPRERREEAAETHLINGQNYRAQHSAKNVQNSMKSNKVYGDAAVLDANRKTENGLKHMLDKFITDTPEFNNNRFFTTQEPVIYGGEDIWGEAHHENEEARDIAAREDYAQQEEERQAREEEEADRHQRELDALEAEHEARLRQEAEEAAEKAEQDAKAGDILDKIAFRMAERKRMQQEQAEADIFAGFAAAGGGGAPAGYSEYANPSIARPSLSRGSSSGLSAGLSAATTTEDYSASGLGSASNIDIVAHVGNALIDKPNLSKDEIKYLREQFNSALPTELRISAKVTTQATLLSKLKAYSLHLQSKGVKSSKLRGLNEKLHFAGR